MLLYEAHADLVADVVEFARRRELRLHRRHEGAGCIVERQPQLRKRRVRHGVRRVLHAKPVQLVATAREFDVDRSEIAKRPKEFDI